MKPKVIMGLLGTVLLFLVFLFGIVIGVGFFMPSDAVSVGIIGGADGPTAIFLDGALLRDFDTIKVFLGGGIICVLLGLGSVYYYSERRS